MSETQDLTKSYKTTELGPLPEEWEVVRLGEVVLKPRQADPRKRPDQRFKYVDVSAVSSASLAIKGHVELEGKDAPSRARKLVRSGDVIFATVRPYLKRVAMVPSELDGHVCSTAFCVIRAKSDVADPNFLFFSSSTDTFVDRVSEHQRGSSYPAVTDKDVLNEPISLPPLPEQQAIAHVLRTVQRAREATEQVIASARELKKGLMRHLFTYGPVPVEEAEQVPLKETEIGSVPEHWTVVGLGEALTQTQYGLSQRGHAEGEYPILRMNNLVDGRVVFDSQQYVDLGAKAFMKFRLREGDLLFNRTNSYELVGKTALFDLSGDYVFASYLIRLVTDTSKLISQYANYYLNASLTQARLKPLASRGVSQSNISATRLKGLLIPLPPLAEQQEIARTLSTVDEKIAAEEKRKRTLEVLFETLLHNLMTGKLRVEDATEVAR